MCDYLSHIEHDADDAKSSSLCLLDIDNFKSVNDRYGHSVGDTLLATVAETLSSGLRAEDRIARWGGEEFLVFLVGRPLDHSVAVASRLCEQVSALNIDVGDGNVVQVTASVGVAQFTPETDDNEVIRRADAAMYQAKDKGKNQVAIY